MKTVSNIREPIIIEKQYKHSIDKVFAAFSQKLSFEQWIAPSDDISTEVLIYDFNIGGEYKVQFTVPEYGNMILSGEFVSIKKAKQICFTWVWAKPDIHAEIDSLVTVDFSENKEYTKIVITHENLSLYEAIERHKNGWHGSLVRLNKYLDQ